MIFYQGNCSWSETYIGETMRNLETRIAEYEDLSHNSEPAEYLKDHPNHSFTWKKLHVQQTKERDTEQISKIRSL